MLHYVVVFFVIKLVAALFGFGDVAAWFTSIAQTLFFLFLVVAAITFSRQLSGMRKDEECRNHEWLTLISLR